jgi:hypothetical protein
MTVTHVIDVRQLEEFIPGWLSTRKGQHKDAMLVLHRGNQESHSWRLHNTRPMWLGRDPHCDIVLPDPRISRYHARIFWDETHYYVEDVNSKNGTHLNGQAVTAPTPLHNDDVLQIALCRKLTFIG